MKLYTLTLLALPLLALSLAGCFVPGDGVHITDDPCVSACEERRDCFAGEVDCAALCDAQADRGCEDTYVDALECQNEGEDICTDEGACEPEQAAYVACLGGSTSESR